MRATNQQLMGRMQPAGRMLATPVLDGLCYSLSCFVNWNFRVLQIRKSELHTSQEIIPIYKTREKRK